MRHAWDSSSGLRRRRERFKESDEVVDLLRGQLKGRVMLHRVAQARHAAVVHVRRGLRDAAQGGHAELAEVAMLRLDAARGVRELGAEVAPAAVALAGEDARAASRGERIVFDG